MRTDQPAPGRWAWPTSLLLGGAAAMTVTAVTLLVVALMRPAPGAAIASTAIDPQTAAPAAVAPAETVTSPLGQLHARADRDQPQVEQLVGYWVPQLSSKMQGTVDNGRTYLYTDILDNHDQWAARYSPVFLLRSDYFSSFSRSGYWVTIVGTGFSSADQANSWCDEQSIPANDCFAKRLAHSAASEGNTAHR
jgi:hypothetical protein